MVLASDTLASDIIGGGPARDAMQQHSTIKRLGVGDGIQALNIPTLFFPLVLTTRTVSYITAQ